MSGTRTQTTWDSIDRRCKHSLCLGDYPKQCPKCMKLIPDTRDFLGGDRRNAMRGIRQMCQNIGGASFITPDGKWAIHVDYYTESKEDHRRDEFNPHHIDHYVRITDKIKSVACRLYERFSNDAHRESS